MKKKGFTLIELLAVIVILAIIALVAIPTLLKVVDKAKQGADKASALGYIDAVEKYAMICNLKQPENCLEANTKYYVNEASNDEVVYSFMDKIIDRVKAETKIGSIYLEDVINVKGDEPASGYVVLDSKSKVIEAEFKMKTYAVSCDDKKCSVTGKVGKQTVTKLEITNKENKLYIAKTLQLNYEIESTEETSVTWKSSDPSIATVDKNGLVTGVSEGNVTITAKAGRKRSKINLDIEKFYVCRLITGDASTLGSLYECNPGDGIKRNFYLFNITDTTKTFIMDRNLEGTTSYANRWTFLNEQTANWTDVTVGIPKRAQICAVTKSNCGGDPEVLKSAPWLYENASTKSQKYMIDGLQYGTYGNSYGVYNFYMSAGCGNYVRPLITISSDLVE